MQSFTLILLLNFFHFSNSYNILFIVPGFSNSHVMFDARLANLLVENGRNKVTFLVEEINPDTKRSNLNNPNIREIRSSNPEVLQLHKSLSSHGVDIFLKEEIFNFTAFNTFKDIFVKSCEYMIGNEKLLEGLRAEKFDLAIAGPLTMCSFALVKKLEVPSHVFLCSSLLLDSWTTMMGFDSPPTFVPHLMSSFSDRMTSMERFRNILGFLLSHYYHFNVILPTLNSAVQKHFGADFEPLESIAGRSSLILVNSEELLDFPRPILHKVLYIGGVGLSNANKLDQDWLDLIESSKSGVVLFSFGSVANASAMPDFWKEAVLKAFSEFPKYTFIWKFDGDFGSLKVPKNVKTVSWTPQNDLLAHPKVKAFITHSGFNSLLESAFHGKPVIIVPLFADQYSNAKRAERKGMAVTIRKNNFRYETLKHALEEILNNESYTMGAQRISKLIKTKPYKAREAVVNWLEYVAENKGLAELEPASMYLSFYQYFGLDILLVCFFILSIILFITYKISATIVKLLLSKFRKTKQE